MVEVELPAPVSGHSPIQICVIRGWNKCIAALLGGYTQKLLSLGYAPEEGASLPMQVGEKKKLINNKLLVYVIYGMIFEVY